MLLNANDSRLSWQGTISLEEHDGMIKPWRLPCKELDFFHADLQFQAAKTAGVRLSLATDSPFIALTAKINELGEGDFLLDLVVDNEIIATEVMDKQNGTVRFEQLDGQYKVIEIWFPPNFGFELQSVEVADGVAVAEVQDSRLKWVTYGSSITHCSGAGSPAMTWPAIVARELDFDLTCLGYGGQCKIDPMMARLVRDLPADIISLKLGINTHDGHFTDRTFSAAVIGTIATIREKHPVTPLVVCSPIWSPARETAAPGAGVPLVLMREIIEHAVAVFKQHGDQHIYYVDGLKLFGPENHALLPDDLHPDAAGMIVLAENFIKEVFEKHEIDVNLKV
ncbi:MAG: GDSL-type esterase/lipase family protein [Victivallaceae bacterium]|nr:GDSL-type esterase/lipase family protein [Victivallaceae bacterium]